jgi:VWFA-related protein
VRIDAAVLDPRGDFVSGLDRKDFRVLVDGADQPVIYFAPIEAPAEILVIVETSPAVYLIHNQHLVAAYALLEGLAPDDQLALATYDQAARIVLPFTPDKSALAASLGKIQYTLGAAQLNFYDCVSAALDWLGSFDGKKAIVILTTGLDSSPPDHWDALEQKLRSTDTVIFSVALGGSLRNYNGKKPASAKKSKSDSSATPTADPPNPLSFARADRALGSLASLTGGKVYFPASGNDFVPAYREIVATLRHLYALGIAPVHDGQFHKIEVQVVGDDGRPMVEKNKPRYRTLARPGYLAPGAENSLR